MSLLLDALKKAAEKKARKSAEDRASADSSQPGADLSATQYTETEIDKTEVDSTDILERTDIDSTEVDRTDVIEQTAIDSTDIMERTELDQTEVDSTDFVEQIEDEQGLRQLDSTEIDETEVDRTELEQTEIDHTELDATHVDGDEIDATELEHTEVEHTSLDDTRIDDTAIDDSEFAQTEVDQTELENTHIDETEIDNVQIGAVSPDGAPMDTTSQQDPVIEDRDLDTTLAATPELTGEDRTLFIYDDEGSETQEISPARLADESEEELTSGQGQETQELPPIKFLDDETASPTSQTTEGHETQEMTPVRYIDDLERRQDTHITEQYEGTEAAEVLTEDDVTEFMGDGLTAEETAEIRAASIGADDTTLTNSDSLSLTNFGYDDLSLEQQEDTGYPSAQDATSTETHSIPGYDGRITADEISTDELSLEDIEEDDISTIARLDDGTSTVDIEKLTNDETVTIKDSTGTRTFAPDNYDRTLLKLADSDVSKIFPGMKTESEAVMTPDYAKKVFINKSQGVKNYYYKIYAGLAMAIFLAVALWGLMSLQEEVDSIDNSLVKLKRDPMPGVIKTKGTETRQKLFTATPEGADDRVIDLLAKVDDPASAQPDEVIVQSGSGSDFSAGGGESSAPESLQGPDAADSMPTGDEPAGADIAVEPERERNTELSPAQARPQTAPARTTESASREPSAPAQRSQSNAGEGNPQITMSSQIDEKDRLLADAYRAYEQGDIADARRLYGRVLSLAPENRDALLGRAAVHVQEKEFTDAISLYQQLLEANPKDSVAMTSLLSVVSIDPREAETLIKNLLREQPQLPYLHFALGNMYGSQSRWLEAQASYFTALQYKPDDPNYAYNLAVSLEHIEKPQSAVTFYQRALDNRENVGLASFDSQLVSQRIEVLSQ